jgi:hypothetical protein
MKNLIESLGGGGRANGLWAGGGLVDRLGRGRRRLWRAAGGAGAPLKTLMERRQRGGGKAKWVWAGVGLLVAAGVAFNLKELIRYIKIARM